MLNAARARFAADGYAAATIREIAADAGVDAALRHRWRERALRRTGNRS
nr:TetR family transcriptional regulator [Actinoplanes sp. L3-i22]